MRRIFRHRFLGVLLLPLLILAGWIGPGGWHCADGSLCEPASAATCCCGDARVGVADCCAEEARSGRVAIDGRPCGCYYQAQAITVLPNAGGVQPDLAPVVPALAATVAAPPSGSHLSQRQRITLRPPRFLISPRDPRAPPAA